MEDRDEKGKFIEGHKGQGGRKKNSVSINDELRKLLATKDPKSKKSYIEVLARKIFNEALKDNDRVLIELWQQMEGRAKQQVEVDANVRTRGEMIIIDASGKVEDDESPLNDNQSES